MVLTKREYGQICHEVLLFIRLRMLKEEDVIPGPLLVASKEEDVTSHGREKVGTSPVVHSLVVQVCLQLQQVKQR